MARLHQLRFDYDAQEDRIRLKFSLVDKAVVQLWFTRRLTKRLWPAMVRLMEDAAAPTGQQDPAGQYV